MEEGGDVDGEMVGGHLGDQAKPAAPVGVSAWGRDAEAVGAGAADGLDVLGSAIEAASGTTAFGRVGELVVGGPGEDRGASGGPPASVAPQAAASGGARSRADTPQRRRRRLPLGTCRHRCPWLGLTPHPYADSTRSFCLSPAPTHSIRIKRPVRGRGGWGVRAVLRACALCTILDASSWARRAFADRVALLYSPHRQAAPISSRNLLPDS